jgi:hypothetical protein
MFTKKRFIGVLGSAVLLAAMTGVSAAHAVTCANFGGPGVPYVNGPSQECVDVSLPITAGTLNFDGGAPAISNFSGVTLNGTPQLTSLSIDPFTVVDATGSGDGWNVDLTIPDLSDGSGHTIASSNISMTAPVVTAASTSSMTSVTPVAITPGVGLATGDEIVTAAIGDGMGTYLVAPRILKLTIPVTTIAGTYVTDATIATVDGP